MSDLLSIGASGLRAYQSALTTVSDNIANASTDGYSRRSIDLSSVDAQGAAFQRPVSGQGVVVSGLTRAGDAFKADEVRSAGADLARSETGISWLQQIDSAMTGSQLSDRMTAFFNSAQAVAADPTAGAPRTAMLESAQTLANAFSSSGTALTNAASSLDAQAKQSAMTLSQTATALANINASLARSTGGSASQAQLLDQRDQLLQTMSTLSDISVSFDSFGRATVKGGGPNGPLLVQGQNAANVSVQSNSGGAISYVVNFGADQQILSPNGGALAGIADGAQRLTAATATLNDLAKRFVDGVNAVQANGNDLDGNAGAAMFSGTTAATMQVAMTDPDQIAAAGAGQGPRDNSNLAALANLRTSGGFETGVTGMVASNGAALSSRQTIADAQSAIRDKAVQSLDSVTGVNLDQEAVDLLRFQQAYQASSRVIQVARETMQSLFQIG